MASDDDHDEALPPPLLAALQAADRPLPVVTARADRAVAAMAEAHFAAGKGADVRRPWRYGWAAGIAAAAALALAVLVVPGQQAEDAVPGWYADVDGSGSIDIADVLALARTRPGRHSQTELDAFARRVVALRNTGGPS